MRSLLADWMLLSHRTVRRRRPYVICRDCANCARPCSLTVTEAHVFCDGEMLYMQQRATRCTEAEGKGGRLRVRYARRRQTPGMTEERSGRQLWRRLTGKEAIAVAVQQYVSVLQMGMRFRPLTRPSSETSSTPTHAFSSSVLFATLHASDA
ncbi:hypothetical protein L226DRAFT_19595 [Lentinus tigrinus ALCF2SS1-7]|uniref:uncharacterized protein n=1 Tax=Lentinus tigrinus ALCF2SS1-7 TaxID=1328758 RepID=UPI001165CAC3|nr:hypothetical protein L226DRAFT_19595 [Lentinus tigrinus ALCF2SS1-7]